MVNWKIRHDAVIKCKIIVKERKIISSILNLKALNNTIYEFNVNLCNHMKFRKEGRQQLQQKNFKKLKLNRVNSHNLFYTQILNLQ